MGNGPWEFSSKWSKLIFYSFCLTTWDRIIGNELLEIILHLLNNTNCYHQAATYEETDVAKQDYIWLRLALFTCNSLLKKKVENDSDFKLDLSSPVSNGLKLLVIYIKYTIRKVYKLCKLYTIRIVYNICINNTQNISKLFYVVRMICITRMRTI
jgi:hypothetical protein